VYRGPDSPPEMEQPSKQVSLVTYEKIRTENDKLQNSFSTDIIEIVIK